MFVCKSISLANFLIANKSNLIKIDKDKENKNYLVFLFETNAKIWAKPRITRYYNRKLNGYFDE